MIDQSFAERIALQVANESLVRSDPHKSKSVVHVVKKRENGAWFVLIGIAPPRQIGDHFGVRIDSEGRILRVYGPR